MDSKLSEPANSCDTIAVAESLTGGLIASLFIDKSGASKYFKGSLVVYSLESKIELLGLSKNLVMECNGVSYDVAKNMAINASKLFKTDYGISSTGYAESLNGKRPFAYVAIYRAKDNKYKVSSVIGNDNSERNVFRNEVAQRAKYLWTSRDLILGS